MPETMNRRNRKFPSRWAVYDTSDEGDFSNRRVTRRNQALIDAATSASNKGKGRGKRTQCSDIEFLGPNWEPEENIVDDELNEDLDEMDGRIQINASEISDVKDNSLVIFTTLFELLPRNTVQEIAKKIQNNTGDDHVWLLDVVGRALSKTSEPEASQMQGLPIAGNPAVAVNGQATTPAAAGAAAGAVPPTTYAAAATTTAAAAAAAAVPS